MLRLTVNAKMKRRIHNGTEWEEIFVLHFNKGITWTLYIWKTFVLLRIKKYYAVFCYGLLIYCLMLQVFLMVRIVYYITPHPSSSDVPIPCCSHFVRFAICRLNPLQRIQYFRFWDLLHTKLPVNSHRLQIWKESITFHSGKISYI